MSSCGAGRAITAPTFGVICGTLRVSLVIRVLMCVLSSRRSDGVDRQVVDESAKPADNPAWFEDAQLNWAENQLRHAKTRPEAIALIQLGQLGVSVTSHTV